MRMVIALLALGMLAGACDGSPPPAGEVIVDDLDVFRGQHETLDGFVAAVPVIVVGEVVGVDDRAYEVPIVPGVGGDVAGDGPDIYGTVTFEVTRVVKGGVKVGELLTLVFPSGKWNDDDRTVRIAYRHDLFGQLQTDKATLRSPAELKGVSFAVFAGPVSSLHPVRDKGLFTGTPARIDGSVVSFSEHAPFRQPATTTLADVEKAVSR